MAKKQTRRSVSIRGSTYELIQQHCKQNNQSMSEFVEERISSFFGMDDDDEADSNEKPKNKPRMSVNELQDAARFFTF